MKREAWGDSFHIPKKGLKRLSRLVLKETVMTVWLLRFDTDPSEVIGTWTLTTNIISNFEFPISDLTFPIVTEKEFGSREVGKKSEFPTFRFSIVTGLMVTEYTPVKSIPFRNSMHPMQTFGFYFKSRFCRLLWWNLEKSASFINKLLHQYCC